LPLILPFLRRGLRPRASAEDRLVRLRRVLDRANVGYSRETPELALTRLPIAMPPARLPALRMQKLRFPIVMPARVALFEGGFETDGAIRVFSAAETARLKAYVPDALVVPLQFALTLADQKRRGLVEFPALTTALVVLTSLGDTPLADHHRDFLWQVFHVPIFEQLRGWDGAVLARECEVHDGLHLDPSAAIAEIHEGELVVTQLTAFEDPILRVRTGIAAEVETDPCECGLESPRLRNLAEMRPKARVAMAS
jgi:hypothetical protein